MWADLNVQSGHGISIDLTSVHPDWTKLGNWLTPANPIDTEFNFLIFGHLTKKIESISIWHPKHFSNVQSKTFPTRKLQIHMLNRT